MELEDQVSENRLLRFIVTHVRSIFETSRSVSTDWTLGLVAKLRSDSENQVYGFHSDSHVHPPFRQLTVELLCWLAMLKLDFLELARLGIKIMDPL